MARNNLILFSDSYPYGVGEISALQPEVVALAKEFETVHLVPKRVDGPLNPTPLNVQVDTGLAASVSGLGAAVGGLIGGALLNVAAWGELGAARSHPRGLRRLTRWGAVAENTAAWLLRFLKARHLKAADVLCYGYRLNAVTAGVARVKQREPDLCLVARGHGDDLCAVDSEAAFFPFRKMTVAALDRLFCATEFALTAAQEQFSELETPMECARVGVADAGVNAEHAHDPLAFVSCSALHPRKRIEQIIEGLRAFAQRYPDRPVHWHHIGRGPLAELLEEHAAVRLPERIKYVFPGQLAHAEVRHRFRTMPFTAYVDASASVSVPVALTEALSCGLPVIAVGHGGIPEAVSDANGLLLADEPGPEQLAAAFASFAALSEVQAEGKRQASRAAWQRQFDAAQTCRHFAGRLRECGN